MISHLIALGYDVNATDKTRGNHSMGTPLHYAIMANSPSTVSLLLQRGADPHKPVGRCGSAYKMAELMGRDQCVMLMKQPPEVAQPHSAAEEGLTSTSSTNQYAVSPRINH